MSDYSDSDVHPTYDTPPIAISWPWLSTLARGRLPNRTRLHASRILATQGVRADEALHKAFHAGVKGGIPISGWRQETVVSRDGSSRVVLFRAADERLCRKDRLGDAVRALFGGEMDSGTRGGGAGAAHKDAWVLLRVRKGRVDACLAFRCRVQRALVRWEAAGKEARSGDGGAACRALENGRGWAEGGESGSGVTDKSRKDSQGSGEIQSREKGPHVENGPKPVLIVVGWWECADAGTTGRNLRWGFRA